MLSKHVLSVALICIVLFLPWLEGTSMVYMTKSERLGLTFMEPAFMSSTVQVFYNKLKLYQRTTFCAKYSAASVKHRYTIEIG